jgi:DNA-binding NarL/FixJ family response regulator
MSKTRVLLADDNSALLNYVTRMLDEDYEVVGAVPGGAEVLRGWSNLRPDVIVLDIAMGELNGLEVARRLRTSGCGSAIVFLTVHEGSDFVDAAMNAGGSAYVVKSRLKTDLIPAITSVLSRKPCLSQTKL